MELPACPVETTLMLIGDKWKVLILRELMSGTKRFGQLKKVIGHVTQKVLTGIHPHGDGLQPAPCAGFHGGLGHRLSAEKRVTGRQRF